MVAETNTHGDELPNALRRMRTLQWMVALLALLWAATVAWMILRQDSTPAVLSVERLEIVEPDGQPALVLANSQRPIAATLDGKLIMEGQEAERKGVPSIIFFDGKGDEVGGMLFGSVQGEDGGFQAVRHLSLDGYKQDQTVVLAHYQNPQGAQSGLIISDRPNMHMFEAMKELGLEPGASRAEMAAAIEALPEESRAQRLRELFGTNRAFFGSSEEDALLILRDGDGRRRVVIEAPKEGEASIVILDENGEPVLRLPEA